MAREGAILSGREAIPTLEQFRGAKHLTTIVGAAVTQIPASNLANRKAILIQNKHASNVVYLGGGIPDVIIGRYQQDVIHPSNDKRGLQWFLSSTGGSANEWFLADTDKVNPSLTDTTYLYYATVDGSETLATEGSVGTLNAEHKWGWGTSADISGDTLFIRTNGSLPENSPKVRYQLIHSYNFTLTADDVTLTGGIELSAGQAISMTLDGRVRVYAIASGATTAVGTLEFI